jgi:hypothetical protein
VLFVLLINLIVQTVKSTTNVSKDSSVTLYFLLHCGQNRTFSSITFGRHVEQNVWRHGRTIGRWTSSSNWVLHSWQTSWFSSFFQNVSQERCHHVWYLQRNTRRLQMSWMWNISVHYMWTKPYEKSYEKSEGSFMSESFKTVWVFHFLFFIWFCSHVMHRNVSHSRVAKSTKSPTNLWKRS